MTYNKSAAQTAFASSAITSRHENKRGMSPLYCIHNGRLRQAPAPRSRSRHDVFRVHCGGRPARPPTRPQPVVAVVWSRPL